MDDRLRRSAAHVLTGDVEAPTLTERDLHHLTHVLRLREGEAVTITDGQGSWRECRLRGGELELAGDVEGAPAPAPALTIAVATPKGDRAEWLVQKCTEVGIDRIVLLAADRSVVRWTDERAGRHGDRLRRVAKAAAMQSRRVWLPELVGPVPARSALGEAVVAEPGGRPLGAADTVVAIGPEGGWSEAELAAAHDRIVLGPHVLRVETAAVVAAALMVAARGAGASVNLDKSLTDVTDVADVAADVVVPVSGPFGYYVHVPFCAKRCDYSAFATWTDRHHLIGDYLDAMRIEVTRAVAAGAPPAGSVFVGGGTPSLVPATGLAGVLRAIPQRSGAEVTVECNPDDVTEELLATYAAAGVNRVSIGVQSMVPHVLEALGRTHDPGNVRRAVAAVRAVGLPTFNVDVIYGAAGETVDDWRTTLAGVLELDPPHVSAYGLTVEPGTPLAGDPARHPDDDVQADEYELADELLTAAGLVNYEVSNWARSGHECRHNLLYWGQHDYLGIGCAAHSHRGGRRWWNVRTPERYIAAVRAGRSTEAAGETLDDTTRRAERLQLALRTRDGVPLDALDGGELPGLVERAGDRWVLTRRGRLMTNEVAVRLRDAP